MYDLHGISEVFHRKDRAHKSDEGIQSTASSSGHFRSRLQACGMRLSILMNEESDLANEADNILRKANAVKSACAVFEREKLDAENRLQRLLEEKDLIEKHLEQQKQKLREVRC